MKIAIINGANINMLGIREPDIYGNITYKELEEKLISYGKEKSVDIEVFQSNHEGALVDKIQECYGSVSGIVINPGAYTHTSIAILDAVKAVSIPTVEVHISKVENRDDFRQVSYVRSACVKTITGKGIFGYMEAVDYLLDILKDR